jgi:small subunit ribosomal protein S10
MNNELRIKLLSYDHSLLDESVKKIIEVAKSNSIEIKGPIPLPTDREFWSFTNSPHVYKSSMEQLERRTHKRLIILKNTTPAVMDSLKRLSLPAAVETRFVNA